MQMILQFVCCVIYFVSVSFGHRDDKNLLKAILVHCKSQTII